MNDRDPRLMLAEMALRIERLEALCVLLCEDRVMGGYAPGNPFVAFVEQWKHEHYDTPTISASDSAEALDK